MYEMDVIEYGEVQESVFLLTIFIQGSLLKVWNGIRLGALTDLTYFTWGSVAAEIYMDDILQKYALPLAPFIGDTYLLFLDKSSPHRWESTSYPYLGKSYI